MAEDPHPRRAAIRRFFAVASLFFFLGTGAFVSDSPIPRNDSQQVALRRPVDLPGLPLALGTGELVLVDGWELSSNNSDFGGFSALFAQGDGRLLALTDGAVLAGFTITDGAIAAESFVAPLPIRKGERATKSDQDAESLTFDPVSGRFWVGYEQIHRIRRFSPGFGRAEASAQPLPMRDWPKNGGAEAIARLPDGRFLVFAEARYMTEGITDALIFATDPAEPGAAYARFGYRPPDGYRITDIAQLPDGRLIALHRRFALASGVSAKIGLIDLADVQADAVVSPRIIATLAPPLPVDNMEGIAVESQGQQAIVWIISDDNFNAFQRSLLLKFVFSAAPALPQS
ncbi:esterase-like activity of phytase family protein [Blastomonas sp.]|uniref:esterase-like activity of phytase family protein n=1 Tax=Blastomonas sp. TaxID=1909299 RepID=UPI0035938638